MNLGRPISKASWTESWGAIVIGSGIGGLAAAALLARHAGKPVLVLDRLYSAGGFTHTFRRPGGTSSFDGPRGRSFNGPRGGGSFSAPRAPSGGDHGSRSGGGNHGGKR